MNKLYWTLVYNIEHFLYEIKKAYQRVVRGYDDTMKYNLDEELAKQIRDITNDLSVNAVGYPDRIKGMTYKKWKGILGDISLGFGSYIEMREGLYCLKDKEYKKLENNFKEGMKLFAKYYTNLWD